MTAPTCVRPLALLAACLLVLPACGSSGSADREGPGTSVGRTTTPAASGSSESSRPGQEPAPTEESALTTDERSGWSFALPQGAPPQTQEQARGVETTIYTSVEDDGGQQSVGVTTYPAAVGPIDNVNPAAQTVALLSRAGASDARQEPGAPRRLAGLEALTSTITFTATNGSKSYWRVTSLLDGRTGLTLQTQVFDDEITPAVRRGVDRRHDALERSLRAP